MAARARPGHRLLPQGTQRLLPAHGSSEPAAGPGQESGGTDGPAPGALDQLIDEFHSAPPATQVFSALRPASVAAVGGQTWRWSQRGPR